MAFDGLAVLDSHGRYVAVNPAGSHILGASSAELSGRASAFAAASHDTSAEPPSPTAGHVPAHRIELPAQDGSGFLDLEYRFVRQAAGGVAVAFRDTTSVRRQQRRLSAFARSAEVVAHAGSLRDTLDMICAEIVRSSGLAAAQILLIDEADLRLQVHGAVPAEVFPPDFTLRLDDARRGGADLKSLVAIGTRGPVVALHRKAAMLDSTYWQPLHAHLRSFEWDSFVSFPLLVHDRPIGALNAYYVPGRQPEREDVAFVGSMADHAAIAVHNAQLIAESKGRAALDERYRLARDLHDSACQELFSLTLELRAAKRALAAGRLAEGAGTERRFEAMERLAYSALGELRALIFELHPTLLHADGLGVAIQRESDAIAARENIDVRVNIPPVRLAIASEVELELYRLAKEAMHNVVKHAEARSVTITLAEDPPGSARLALTVVDDGIGFDPDRSAAGLGLTSMRERAERIGGRLTVESRASSGTTVRAVVPGVLAPAPPPREVGHDVPVNGAPR